MKRIYWLASYPKSGNTWLRLFLANLLRPDDAPVDINAINSDGIASNREVFDRLTGLPASTLLPDEIDELRPQLYRHQATLSPKSLYVKIHDAYTHTRSGEAMLPLEVTAGVVYLVRNPLDVAVSYANHNGADLDKQVTRLCDPNYCAAFHPDRLTNQLRQHLKDWSGHVESWLTSPLPLLLVRYEDMLSTPLPSFRKIVDFLGVETSDSAIGVALDHCRFDKLKTQEQIHGFREKPARSTAFFRHGKSGSWRDALSQDQVERIVLSQGSMMKRLGYLTRSEHLQRESISLD